MYINQREVNAYDKMLEKISNLSEALDGYLKGEGSYSNYAVVILAGKRLTLGEASIYLSILKKNAKPEDIPRIVQLERELLRLVKKVKTQLMLYAGSDRELSEIKRCLDSLVLELRYGLDLVAVKKARIDAKKVYGLTWEDVEDLEIEIKARRAEMDVKKGFRF